MRDCNSIVPTIFLLLPFIILRLAGLRGSNRIVVDVDGGRKKFNCKTDGFNFVFDAASHIHLDLARHS